MKILLTGSDGFIGSHFKKAIQSNLDIELDCWDLKIGRDIADIRLEDLIGVDVIVHLASWISVPHSFESPVSYIENNTVNTMRLIKLAKIAGVKKFLFSSSSSVYADPLSPYGASKLSAEKCLDCYKNDLDIVILRFFNVYGEGQNREYSGVITKFFEGIKKEKQITIYGDGQQTRDFTYVGDVVNIIKNIILNDYKFSQPFDVAKGQSISISDLAKTIFQITGIDCKIRYEKARKEIRYSMGNPTEALKVIPNFTPIYLGLKKMYESISNS